MKVEVGDKIYIPEHKRPFCVKARDNRYIICTKPYNPKHTVIYFIIDLQDKWREHLMIGYSALGMKPKMIARKD